MLIVVEGAEINLRITTLSRLDESSGTNGPKLIDGNDGPDHERVNLM